MISTVLRAPIRFDAEGGAPVHAPMVIATVGALSIRLILDTGADVHLLTREVAEQVGLDLGAVDAGTDHAGAEMDSWLAGDAAIQLPGSTPPDERLTLRDVVVIPAPAAFTNQGIAGGLSPQRLSATAYAVLDLIADELLLVDGEPDEVRRWLEIRHPELEVLSLARVSPEHLPIVEAAVVPHAPGPVLLNTGGRHTEFSPTVVPGLAGAGEARQIGTGVSGAAVMGVDAGAQALELGGRRMHVRNLWLREGMANPPAMIGSDILRGTALAVGPDPSTPVLWQVAATPDDRA